MKAFTVWQPWASLIIVGYKPYEFRSWPCPRSQRGKRTAIHAGARKVNKQEIYKLIERMKAGDWTTGLKPEALPLLEEWFNNPHRLPLSSIVGTAIMGEPVRSWQVAKDFGGHVNDSDRDEHCNWAWPMIEPRPCEPIVPAKGAQGFWKTADMGATA